MGLCTVDIGFHHQSTDAQTLLISTFLDKTLFQPKNFGRAQRGQKILVGRAMPPPPPVPVLGFVSEYVSVVHHVGGTYFKGRKFCGKKVLQIKK